jgi:ComF family protein
LEFLNGIAPNLRIRTIAPKEGFSPALSPALLTVYILISQIGGGSVIESAMLDGLAMRSRALWETGLGFFYPNVCQLCHENRARREQGYICESCASQVQWIEPPFCERCGALAMGAISGPFVCAHCSDVPPSFVTARAAALIDPTVREVIHRYKYGRALYFEPFLIGLLASRIQVEPDWRYIAPVPLHSLKLREREFNQSERLAQRLGKILALPVRTDLVCRKKPTPSQTRLSRKERAENMRNAFEPAPRAKLHGEKILLIDDIMTTGATTSACAAALCEAGAGAVSVWAVARGK